MATQWTDDVVLEILAGWPISGRWQGIDTLPRPR